MNSLRNNHPNKDYIVEKGCYWLLYQHWGGLGQWSPQTGFVGPATKRFFYDWWMLWVLDLSTTVFVSMKLCILHGKVSSNVFLEMEPPLSVFFPRVTSNHQNQDYSVSFMFLPQVKWEYGSMDKHRSSDSHPSAALVSFQGCGKQQTTRNVILFFCSRNWPIPPYQYSLQMNWDIEFMDPFLTPAKSKGSEHTRNHRPQSPGSWGAHAVRQQSFPLTEE